MEPKGKRPSGKGCGRAWLHVKVLPGHKWDGWIAGPPVGIESHHIHNTKPCLKSYFGPQADCPGCNHPSRVEDQWLVPLYRCSDGRPVCVWFHEDMADALFLTKLHEHVVVGKTHEPKTGAYLQRQLSSTNRYQTTLPERRVTADISEYMPVLFGMVGIITPQQLRDGPIVLEDTPACAGSPETKTSRIQQHIAKDERAEIEKSVRKKLKGAAENVIANEVQSQWIRWKLGLDKATNGTH